MKSICNPFSKQILAKPPRYQFHTTNTWHQPQIPTTKARFPHINRASSPPDTPTCAISPQSFPNPTTERNQGVKDQQPCGAGMEKEPVSPAGRAIPLEPLQHSPCRRSGSSGLSICSWLPGSARGAPSHGPGSPGSAVRGSGKLPDSFRTSLKSVMGRMGQSPALAERGAQELPAPQARIKRTESPFT